MSVACYPSVTLVTPPYQQAVTPSLCLCRSSTVRETRDTREGLLARDPWSGRSASGDKTAYYVCFLHVSEAVLFPLLTSTFHECNYCFLSAHVPTCGIVFVYICLNLGHLSQG